MVEPVDMQMVRGGIQIDGTQLYIGRGRYNDGIHPGTYKIGSNTLRISWGGDEIMVEDFEILYGGPSSFQWIRMEGRFSINNTDGFVPIIGGHESDDRPLYVIQGFYKNEVICGKIRNKSLGFLPYHGEEVAVGVYSVLVQYKAPHAVQKGRFKTMHETSTARWERKPAKTVSRSVPILNSPSSPPRIAFCLDSMDLSNTGQYWRIHSYVDKISTNEFYVHVDTWSTSILFDAGFSWLQIGSTNPDFRCGVVHAQGETTQRVSFDWVYEEPPQVFIALYGFDLGRCPRISVKANRIDRSGFELEVKKWDDTIIYGFHATWIAFPQDDTEVRYGSFSANATRIGGSVTFLPLTWSLNSWGGR